MLQHQCENYTIDRSDKVEDKEIKKEEANVAEEVTKDFEPTEGAQEAGSEDTKKKVKKSKQEIKIEELEAQLEKLKSDTKKDREAYLLAKADLENVRKRVEENAIIDRKYAAMGLVSDLIVPVDMLVKASSMETEDPQMKNFLIGFQMIANQISTILKNDGLTEIEALKGKPFDHNIHQAISKEHVDGVEPGQILEVLQTGYKYKDRLIKPAMVKVSE